MTAHTSLLSPPGERRAPDQPGSRVALVAVLAALLVVLVESTVLMVALPTVQPALGAGLTDALWSLVAYALVCAAMAFVWPEVAARTGRRAALLAGMALFATGSLACVWCDGMQQLVACRVLMGAGGAAVATLSAGLLGELFSGPGREAALRACARTATLAIPLGPPLGGLLTAAAPTAAWLPTAWGLVFLVGGTVVGVAAPAVLLGTRHALGAVPPRPLPAGWLLPVTAAALLIVGTLLLAGGTQRFDLVAIGLMLAGTVLAALAGGRDRVDPQLLVCLAVSGLVSFSAVGIAFTLSYLLQDGRGLDPVLTGAFFLPYGLGHVLAHHAGHRWLQPRLGAGALITAGLMLLAISQTIRAVLPPGAGTWLVLGNILIFGLGAGAAGGPAAGLLAGRADSGIPGSAAVVQHAVRQVGGALGLAVIGGVTALRYGDSLAAAASGPAALLSACHWSSVVVVAAAAALGFAVVLLQPGEAR